MEKESCSFSLVLAGFGFSY